MRIRYFNLFASTLEVECHQEGLEKGLLSLVEELECGEPDTEKPISKIVLKQDQLLAIPKNHETFLSQDINTLGRFEFSKSSTGWNIFQPGNLLIEFSLDSSECTIRLSNECPDERSSLAAAFALDHLLGIGGQCMIHAACLDTDDGSSRIILHAPSGTGKTTLALILAKAGYRIASDDAVVIGMGPGADVTAWGLPRDFKIYPDTAKILDWLLPATRTGRENHRGKLNLSYNELGRESLIADLNPKPVIAVIGLKRKPGNVCCFNRLDKFDGLMSLIDDNIHFGPAGFFPGHDRRLDIYCAMLKNAVSFDLHIGNEPNDAVEVFSRLMGSCRV